MMTRCRLCCPGLLLAITLAALPAVVSAHFLQLIPSTDLVTGSDGREVELALTFSHPMQRGPAMEMTLPTRFGVIGPAGSEDLMSTLIPVEVDGKRAYRSLYKVQRPGGYHFFVEPAPYWEPGEGVMIVHYTKVILDAFGGADDWDRDIGLPVEITPLSRPFGLWTGNLFRGIVKRQGLPVPFAEVEVEWLNDGSLEAPADAFVTQVVKADANGVFAYAMPRAGWWGFAALLEAPEKMHNPQGEPVAVETGGVIWVHSRDMR